ncbi:hypothetical protein BGX38DRAFT_189729 [Terfezia claveryi]|nr:hypothetical protein BGX38DRAFT_189729 [Terfezia claveryi]
MDGLVGGVSKLDMSGEDEVQRQVMEEVAAAAASLSSSTETPPTSPEKDEEDEEEEEKPPAPSPKEQQRRATLISTSVLSPRPTTPQNISSVAIETVPPTPGPPPPQSSKEEDIAIDNNGDDAEGEAEEGKSSLLSPRPTTPLLTPDRRGGLRRKSSRLTLSPGTSRGASPTAEIPKLRLSSGRVAVGSSAEEVKIKGLADMHKERLSTSSMVSVAVTPRKVKTGIAIGEYEVYSDSEGEEKEEEKKEEKKEEQEALQPKHDPAPGEASKKEEQEEEEEDWSEWGKSTATEEELKQLLSLCTGNEVIDFNEHIKSELKSSTLSKLGEASYSEVFLQTPHTGSSPLPARTVLKIIPFGYPTQCPLKQIYDELLITASMAPIPGFIGFHSAHIVRGRFPQPLLDLWDHWDQHVKAGGSENDRPDFYNEGQLFAVIGLEDGGRDLEAWSFKGEVDGEGGWREAREVFWRVAGALARGEEEREFEHRDLHFGNIVIKRMLMEVGESEDELLRNLSLDDGGGGKGGKAKGLSKRQHHKSGTPVIARTQLQVSLIDYTLSRARDAYGLLSFTPLDDEALFEGKGDYQFDIYRL